MIASIEGRITAVFQDWLTISVQGIGYKVYAPPSAFGKVGEETLLHTSLIVREDSLTLFGFVTSADRDLFELLLTISGVGPKVALSILTTLNADNLRNAVVADRPEILTRVPGIGKKTAQKILFELKDKLPKGLDAAPITAFDDVNSDVIDTLVALGYSIIEAQTAVQAMPSDAPPNVEERVRLALQYFA
ncbi:MAG: Holliday junction branch migration protein RuvA [Anaerolineae bacterium]|jgi:Holliday junction DNA helicase RuvA|nr:Holliday junction branch migration protein RuvA [Anaerolineae bacterium]